ncbi:glycerol-3-phosphate acyltransferase [Lapillicoccus jejuensis]|uniref:Glycerol-3-phosphate acyltransferase n=1 Tax=Lapillicoccus jejuensis TaxID=402171 RepID=A0A542DVC3_9MICO|nr:glycerol-3-phosphate acyltransferase [Lapillicoccus jejuensis]TQJ07051.1 acyl-phosphate glycerol-3-phosphate acyltransferase [Lapillicoccus jejuensis]
MAVALGAVAAFLLGSVNPATIVARVLGRDLATAGSGNPGATNAGRVLGARWGVLVGLLDVAKGFVPSVLALHLGGHGASYVVGVAAVLGHVWSPFLRGHGGKGVATALGAVLGVLPWFALVMVVVFVAVVALGRWVAGASVAAAGTLVVLGVLAGLGRTGPLGGVGWSTTAYGVVLSGVVLARHRPNLQGWSRARRSR